MRYLIVGGYPIVNIERAEVTVNAGIEFFFPSKSFYLPSVFPFLYFPFSDDLKVRFIMAHWYTIQ